MHTLEVIIVFLLCAVIAVPLFKRLGLGSVLGYLAAGVIVGPRVIGLVTDVDEILHFAELGVVLLLFVIGLELQPQRLWAMRRAILGFGSGQVLLTGILVGSAALLLGVAMGPAILIGLSLALSSTAFALQLMAERGMLTQRCGRSAFSVLLFQDLAVVPLLAIIPLLGDTGQASGSLLSEALKSLGVLAAIILGGHYLLQPLLRIVATSGVREVLTGMALLTALGTAYLASQAGLSMALGAFLAGVLLADSEFRHQLKADIEPFKGLLLGLFFIAVGMSLNIGLVAEKPLPILGCVVLLVSLKTATLYALGRWHGLDHRASLRLGLILSQGGEFAFVLFTAAVGNGLLAQADAQFLIVVVSLSMAMTPLLLLADEQFQTNDSTGEPDYDQPDNEEPPVIIAGFGRFAQITARVLNAKQIGFIALDSSSEQVDFLRKYGHKIYYGDASRVDLLESAGAHSARLFVLAIADVEASLETAAVVRKHFPNLTIYARARDRKHAYRLMDLGIEHIVRETFYSALELTRSVLRALSIPEDDVRASIERFRAHDVKRLFEHQHLHDDEEQMQDLAKAAALELEEMFERDEQVVQELNIDTEGPAIERPGGG